MSEFQHQCNLFKFLGFWQRHYPELSLIHAIPNGLYLSRAEAGKAVAQGVRRGVWDIFCPLPRVAHRSEDGTPFYQCASRGLYVEMKAGRNGLTPEQEAFRAALEPHGYRFAVCRSWCEAARVIGEHLAIDHPDWLKAVEPLPVTRPLFGPGSRGPRKAKVAV